MVMETDGKLSLTQASHDTFMPYKLGIEFQTSIVHGLKHFLHCYSNSPRACVQTDEIILTE